MDAESWDQARETAHQHRLSVSALIRKALRQLDTDRGERTPLRVVQPIDEARDVQAEKRARAEAEHAKVSKVSPSPELAEAFSYAEKVAANAHQSGKPVPSGIASLLASPEHQEWARSHA